MVLLVSLRYQLFPFYRWGVEARQVTCSCSYEVSQSLKFILIALQPLLESNHLDFSSLKTEAPQTSFKPCLNPAVRHAVRNNIAFGFLFLHNFMTLGTEGLQRGDCISWFLVKFSRGLEAAWTVLSSFVCSEDEIGFVAIIYNKINCQGCSLRRFFSLLMLMLAKILWIKNDLGCTGMFAHPVKSFLFLFPELISIILCYCRCS